MPSPPSRPTGSPPRGAALDLTCALAPSGYLVRTSQGFREAVGLSGDTLTARPMLDFLHPADRAAVEGALAWLGPSGEPIVFECRWRHGDGTYRWLEWTVQRAGRDEVMRATVHDVTRWKQDETLALAQARVLEAVVQGAPLAELVRALGGVLDGLGLDAQLAVHLVEPSGTALALAGSTGLDEGFARAISALPLPDGPGAAVAAVREGQLVMSPDLGLETLWRGRRELPLSHGVRAEWSQPIAGPAAPLGAVTVFLPQPRGPRPRDRQLLATAAQLMATALASTRERATPRDEAAQLRAELASLRQESSEVLAERGQLLGEVRELARERDAVRESARAEAEALRAELATVRDEATRALEALRGEAAADLERMIGERNALREALTGREHDASATEEERSRLADRVRDAELERDGLRDAARRELEALRGELDDARERAAIAEATAAAAAAPVRDAATEAELERTLALLEARELALAATKAALEEAQRAGEAFATHKAELESRVVEAEVAQGMMQGDLEQAQFDADRRKRRLRRYKRKLQELEVARDDLAVELEAMRARVQESLEGRAALLEQVAEAEAARDRLADGLAELREAASATAREAGEELEGLRARLLGAESALRDLEQARGEPTAGEAGGAAREQLEQALWRTQQDGAAYQAWADAEIATLRLRLAEFDAIRHGLEEHRRTLGDDLGAARAELAATTARVAELEAVASEGRDALEDVVALRAQLAESSLQRDALAAAVTEARQAARAAAAPTDVDEDLAALSARLAESEAARQRLEAALADAWRTRPGAAETLDDDEADDEAQLRARVAELEAALFDARQQAEETRREMERLREHCDEERARLADRVAALQARANGSAAEGEATALVRQVVEASGDAGAAGEPLDLTALVDRLRGELHAMLPQQITLHVRLTPHLPPMLGDSAQMRQVLAQLVSNSAEALEGRGGVISVATGVVDADRSYLLGSGAEETLPEGRYLFLEVSDTGHGMDAATLASIFDPQFSTRAPTRGLGLAIVQGIVRGHHGAMQVYSKPDVGTTVRVLLPSAELARRRPGQESGTAGPATTRESEAVLVLDRDRTIRGAAARILERWGFTVLEAADLEEGLALLRHSEKVRLVLLEADLGGDDEPAATALKRLREGMQVVLAGEPNGSGNGSEAAAIVARPFGPVELVAAVRAALRGKQVRSEK